MKGFTLLETAVVLAIMSILTGLILTGWPRARQQQALLLATEQVQTMVRTAQQKALNEDRSDACLATVPNTPEGKRLCSDIGVAIKNSDIRIFADTQEAAVNKYNEQNNTSAGDFILEKQTLPLGVTSSSGWQEFVFEATPPTILLVGGPNKLLTLYSGNATKTVTIKNYGQVE